jgi:hypothetical protein
VPLDIDAPLAVPPEKIVCVPLPLVMIAVPPDETCW